MNIPSIEKFNSPIDSRNSAMNELETELNQCLSNHFENSKEKGHEYLAKTLIEKVESIVDDLNAHGYGLGRSDYGGDVNYENSEQWFCNGPEMGTGLTIHFLGFEAKVWWENA